MLDLFVESNGTYDGLDRLTAADRGDLNGGKTGRVRGR